MSNDGLRCLAGPRFSPLQPFSLKVGFGEKRRTLEDPQETLAFPKCLQVSCHSVRQRFNYRNRVLLC